MAVVGVGAAAADFVVDFVVVAAAAAIAPLVVYLVLLVFVGGYGVTYVISYVL